jgi:hypothetical protein
VRAGTHLRPVEVAFTPSEMCDQVQSSALPVGEGAQVVAALHAALASLQGDVARDALRTNR